MTIYNIENNMFDVIEEISKNEANNKIIVLLDTLSVDAKEKMLKKLEESNFDGIVLNPIFELDEKLRYIQIVEMQYLRIISNFIIFWFDEQSKEYIECFKDWKSHGNCLIGGLVDLNEDLGLPYHDSVDSIINHFLEVKDEEPIRMLITDDIERVESGPLKINDDWTGYFLRGDNAIYLSTVISKVLDPSISGPELEMYKNSLASFGESLQRVIV